MVLKCTIVFSKLLAVEREFRKFSLSLVESFWFSSTILLVISLDALCIGLLASEFVALRVGKCCKVDLGI